MTLGLALCGQDFILVAADKQETVTLKHGGRLEPRRGVLSQAGSHAAECHRGPGAPSLRSKGGRITGDDER